MRELHLTRVSSRDIRFQDGILKDVSRTFALTIPTLPDRLSVVVGNAYLLCRIADTIEDEPGLNWRQKRYFSELFISVTNGEGNGSVFARKLIPLLTDDTLLSEKDLVRNTETVIRITNSFSVEQRSALTRCIKIMSNGMAEFQRNASCNGLTSLRDLDRYCYCVAGVVGEMLTELFCDEVKIPSPRRQELMTLAVSFGQGLQMTNILKDIWEDSARGVCWLPQDIFAGSGFPLKQLHQAEVNDCFEDGLGKMIAIAAEHLRDALAYTLTFPVKQTGIRRFCLWALGMAILTLRKINNNRGFTRGEQVKIKRFSVKSTAMVTSLFASNDKILTSLFELGMRNLPKSTAVDRVGREF